MVRERRDVLESLVHAAEDSIRDGYYKVKPKRFAHRSLEQSILNSQNVPVVAEIKFASPVVGRIRDDGDVRSMAQAMERGGASGISVLTEPKFFKGSLGYLSRVKETVKLPVLMKDIVIDPVQTEAGRAAGADAVLLVYSIYGERYVKRELKKMIEHAHSLGLEVLLETHSAAEFREALASKADIVGINNRDLKSLQVSVETSVSLLRRYKHSKTVICESGFTSPREIRNLDSFGADGFLIGSSIMKSADIETTVRSFTGA